MRSTPRGTVRFEDGSELEVDAVVWATGFRPDYSWIDLPVLDDDGRLRHRRGVTDVPGLYFVGLTWQHTRGSALLGWVKDDAAYIAERMAAFEREPERVREGVTMSEKIADQLPDRDRGGARRHVDRGGRAGGRRLVRARDRARPERIGDALVRMLAYNGRSQGLRSRLPKARP